MLTWDRAVLLRMTIAFASIAALLLALGAAAKDLDTPAALPRLERCKDKAHPLLPDKWHGTYLMAPFIKAQLTLADIVYDSSISAVRIRLYGLKHGSLDLFIQGRTTFLLARDHVSGEHCMNLGDTGLRPPPRDWLAPNAQCAGSAPVGGVSVDWWKTPSSVAPSATWIWYRTGSQIPYRLMFTQPADEPAVLGWYALSYGTGFESLSATDLGAIARTCQSTRQSAGWQGRLGLRRMIDAMQSSPFRADEDIARIMPGINTPCSAAPLPNWPKTAAMTAFMTPPHFDLSPFPTEILYDWNQRSQRTRMFSPSGAYPETEDSLLMNGEGFSLLRSGRGGLSCKGALPGTIRPNWPETGGCSCEAIIKGASALTQSEPATIMVCPMTHPRVVWSWFTLEGRPTVFMETSAPGDDPAEVLALVDYYSWIPGHRPERSVFDAPSQCPAPAGSVPASRARRRSGQSPSRCGACHLDQGATP